MAFQLAPMTEADIEEFVRIHRAAFANGIATVLWAGPHSPETNAKMRDRFLKAMREDPAARFVKVTDTSTGETIAVAKWSFFFNGRTQEKLDEATRIPEPGPDANIPAWHDFFGYLMEERKAIGTKPYVFLDILDTEPQHHRRGAGSMILRWGLQQADGAGLETYLEATDMGRPLYERFGFKPVKERYFDLTAYGGQGTDRSTIMLRPLQKPDVASN